MQQLVHRRTPAAVRRRLPGRAARRSEGRLDRPGTTWVGLPQNAMRVYCGTCLSDAVQSASRSVLGPQMMPAVHHIWTFLCLLLLFAVTSETPTMDRPVGSEAADLKMRQRLESPGDLRLRRGVVGRSMAWDRLRYADLAPSLALIVPSARRPYRRRREPQVAQRTERAVAELNAACFLQRCWRLRPAVGILRSRPVAHGGIRYLLLRKFTPGARILTVCSIEEANLSQRGCSHATTGPRRALFSEDRLSRTGGVVRPAPAWAGTGSLPDYLRGLADRPEPDHEFGTRPAVHRQERGEHRSLLRHQQQRRTGRGRVRDRGIGHRRPDRLRPYRLRRHAGFGQFRGRRSDPAGRRR